MYAQNFGSLKPILELGALKLGVYAVSKACKVSLFTFPEFPTEIGHCSTRTSCYGHHSHPDVTVLVTLQVTLAGLDLRVCDLSWTSQLHPGIAKLIRKYYTDFYYIT